MRETLAKILFCNVYDLENVLLHIPVGAVNVFVAVYSGWVALLFGAGFLAYEVLQRVVERKDKAYPDIQGWLWGIGILSIILLLVRVI